MTEIPLGRSGYVALVDDADVPLVAPYRWHMTRGRGRLYARGDTRAQQIFMHRLILGATPGIQTDHKNNDGLDNRRENIRLATPSQNNANRHVVTGASRFRGVVRHGKNWAAKIMVNNRRFHVGTFRTEEEAARAYDGAAIEAWGEFARPNFLGVS